MQTTDIKKLEESKKAFLYAEDVGRFLGVTPHYIRIQARHDPAKLGFPVIVVGSSVRIPRIPFLNFVKGTHEVFELEEMKGEKGEIEWGEMSKAGRESRIVK